MAGGQRASGLRRQLKLLLRAPTELRILYVLNFLNSYKYFSMALVLPIIATTEYGFSDVTAGALYGAWGILITLWGLLASFMVDNLGVRFTSIFSTAASVVARGVFVFGRSQTSLLVVVLVLSPMGDGTFDPCFNVGVKKCTTDVTRPFAYALAYTVMNLGGAFTDNLTEAIRRLEGFDRGFVRGLQDDDLAIIRSTDDLLPVRRVGYGEDHTLTSLEGLDLFVGLGIPDDDLAVRREKRKRRTLPGRN